ncbi:50S ribosomal protein L17 [Patescibacteria group bacterium]|nr:50S ribosomal protein L17 [Patescibacteria group bacterium]
MRHLKKGRKFGLKRGQRKSFLKVLVNNLISHEHIMTTEARAKEIRKITERYVTYGKKQNLAGMKLLLKYLPKKSAYKIYHDIAPRYAKRNGGYLRILKMASSRKNDGSKMAKIEFV